MFFALIQRIVSLLFVFYFSLCVSSAVLVVVIVLKCVLI